MRLRFGVGVVLLITILGCDAPPAETGSIRAFVVDEGGRPVAVLGGRADDANGRKPPWKDYPEVGGELRLLSDGFEITGVEPGRYNVVPSVGHWRQWPEGAPRVVVDVTPGEVAEARFVLPDAGIVRGRVINTDGRPVVDAHVGWVGRDVVTGPDGTYTLEGVSGSIRFQILREGYKIRTEWALVPPGGTVDHDDVELHAGSGSDYGIGCIREIRAGEY